MKNETVFRKKLAKKLFFYWNSANITFILAMSASPKLFFRQEKNCCTMDSQYRELYPLMFETEYCSAPWGGCLLRQGKERTGEAWEIADRARICNGPLAGMTLHSLMSVAGAEIVGSSWVPGMRFPLIVKLIDTADMLSLQLHPESKTEVWYIMEAEPDAVILAGLAEGVTSGDLVTALPDNDSLMKLMQVHKAVPGDMYCILPGRVHSIGGGILLLEIQTNCNITYRFSDWNRKPERPLHVEQALSILDTSEKQHVRLHPEDMDASMPFRVLKLEVNGEMELSTEHETYHVLTATNKPVQIHTSRNTCTLPAAHSCLIPAQLGNYKLSGDMATVILATQ